MIRAYTVKMISDNHKENKINKKKLREIKKMIIEANENGEYSVEIPDKLNRLEFRAVSIELDRKGYESEFRWSNDKYVLFISWDHRM